MLKIVGIFCVICIIASVSSQPLDVIDGRRPPIVGGYEIDIERTPYQISLRRRGRHICGGSIYSDHIVITAGHCIYGTANSRDLSVVAGATLINSNVGQEFRVARFILHPKYKDLNKDYDVAIFVLNGRFQFNKVVQPIPLAKEMAPEGSNVFISGWGYLDVNIPITPNHLMATE
uniref:Peptidase S1 domain-containing protein n=1 Tax=Megaselia scalaris TaxID=36166 RepID=T1GX36_MEGSC